MAATVKPRLTPGERRLLDAIRYLDKSRTWVSAPMVVDRTGMAADVVEDAARTARRKDLIRRVQGRTEPWYRLTDFGRHLAKPRRDQDRAVPLATRYSCPHELSPGAGLRHDRGSGQPPRGKCSGCGGRLVTVRGRWGVFPWTGTGRYPADQAESTYAREGVAQARADKLNAKGDGGQGGMVVRWIGEGGL